MADININLTQAVPEIPEAANPPVSQPMMGTPLERTPTIITSKKARKRFDTNVELFEQLTGQQITL